MDDREQRDGSRLSLRSIGRLGFERLQLAAGRAVDHVPSAGTKRFTDRIRGDEVTLQPALDALVEKALSLLFIRSSWL